MNPLAFDVPRLSDAFPDSRAESPQARKMMLFSSAEEHLRAARCLRQNREGIFHVYFPLMHQCIEFSAKSLVLHWSPETDVGSYQHKTIKLMQEFQERVPVFKQLLSDEANRDLLSKLESAYRRLRYGEAGLYHGAEAQKRIDFIASYLLVTALEYARPPAYAEAIKKLEAMFTPDQNEKNSAADKR